MPDSRTELQYQQTLELANPLYIDVRSPFEYAQDHLPGARNLPLFDDTERAQIGEIYRNQSPEEARYAGLDLVAGKLPGLMRQLTAWSKEEQRPLVIYCWRGGMRSRAVTTVAQLMYIPCYRLSEGYRGYRHWLMERVEAPLPFAVVVLHGLTGCGKTRILQLLQERHGIQVADLEGLANHRGSVFGSVGLGGQPTQKQFQGALWQELRQYDPARPLVVECESRRIGQIMLDPPFFEAMKAGGHVLVYDSVAGRAKRLVQDYAPEQNREEIRQALLSPPLRKRIAKEKLAELEKLLDSGGYEELTRYLLTDYYDPLYHYPDEPSAQYDFCVSSASEEAAAAELAAYLRGLTEDKHANED